jgi:CHAT domain-containing protein/tetratricopeptide (TPR) repeat protein
MRWNVFIPLLAGVLSPVLYGQAGELGHNERGTISGFPVNTAANPSVSSTPGNRSRNALQQRAETAFEAATVLREKQTYRDLTAAARLLKGSARLFETNQAPERAAEAHLRVGEIYFTLSQYGEARRSFREVLRLAHDPEVRCKAVSRMARTYATIGPSSLADQFSNQAMNLCKDLSERAQAEALEARGETLNFAGERSDNEDYFLRARDLFAAAKDADGQAQALMMLAYSSLFSGGKPTQGLGAAGQALQLWSSTGNRHGVARMRSILGTWAIARGEFETAQCNYKEARPVFREIGNKDDEGIVLNGLGFVSRETGDWEKSLQYYRAARAIFSSVHDLLGELEAIQGMGKALAAMKSYKALVPLYEAEQRVARQAGDPVAVAYAEEDLATAYEAQQRYAEAELFYGRALKGYRAANHLYSEGDVLIRLGRLQATQKRFSKAITLLQRANALKEKTGQIAEVAKINYELASIYGRLKRLDEARAAIEKTIEIIEKERLTISHFDSRASYFASVHRYYALYIQTLMLLHYREPTLGYEERAFDASERSKVRSLLDLLTTSAQEAPCDELLQRQLDGSEPGTAEERLPTTELASSTVTMKQLQAEMEDDTVLLEYVLGDEKSYVWVVSQHHFTSYELPGQEQIRKLVEAFRRTLLPPQWKEGESAVEYQMRARRTEEEFQAYSRQLSRLLLGNVRVGRTKRILVVPDQALQYIPFAALPLPGPTTNRELLVSRQEVVLLPSASVLASLRKAAAKRAPASATAAIFADPVFESDDPRVSAFRVRNKSSAQTHPPALTRAINDIGAASYIPRLPASRNEAIAIAAILRSGDPQGVHVALDFDASREFVLAEGLSRFRLVHFATHGLVDTRNPESSGLILSLIDRTGRKGDGYLRLGDIYKLKLSADLVVLSSCDSALGKALESEGIIGLPRGFLYAGAKSVIATLWKVNDEATAKLMTRLYARIQRGETPSSALRGAQVEMAHDKQWSKPYYWAAFSLQGDYR